MLVERLRKEWCAREVDSSFHATPCLKSEGLVLAAGTVLAPTPGAATSDGGDDRLRALLSVAYGGPIAGRAIGHVKAAALRWREGETARAALHLALSRLGPVDHPRETARRLFMADGLMRAGMEPGAILKALEFERPHDGAIAKYSPTQPRVPAGSGRTSGEWTGGENGNPANPSGSDDAPTTDQTQRQDASTASSMPVGGVATADRANNVGSGRPGLMLVNFAVPNAGAGLASGLDLGAMSAVALSRLVIFLGGLAETGAAAVTVTAAGAIAALGVLFIPNKGPKGRWIEVGGPGDVSYYQHPDETAIVLKYTTADGVQHTFATSPGPDGGYPGPDGRVIGRLIMTGAKAGLVISTVALVGRDAGNPRACPAPVKDNGGELGAAYEDYAKALFNPGNPTPHKMAYAFFNPATGNWVKIDDCQQKFGNLAEYKGPNYAYHLIKNDFIWNNMESDMIEQADRQVASSEGRHLTWYFDEEIVADRMREKFSGTPREIIDIRWLPWPGKPKK